MEKVSVKTQQGSYNIVWTQRPFDALKGRGVIVTDRNIFEIYKELLADRPVIVIEPGEVSKTLEMAGEIVDRMLDMQLERGDYIAAFGGGVVGDLAGFAASIYKRGCRYYQIPTSLIAVVDSSVGGKTAVNHSDYKNVIGSFYSPESVLINLRFLDSLPSEEWLNGAGEVLKYAILDQGVYDIVTEGENIDWEQLFRMCLQVKKRYVEEDYYDQGIRQHLNLGHTFGHAIERYDGTPHGIAVAYGIYMVIKLFHIEEMEGTFAELCERLGISLAKKYAYKNLRPYLLQDKKNKGKRQVFIVPEAIGKIKMMEVSDEFFTEDTL